MNTLGAKLLTIAGVTAVTGGILSVVGGKSPDTDSPVDKQGSSGQEQVIQQAEKRSEKRLPNRELESSVTSEVANKTTSVAVSTNSVKVGEMATSEPKPIISEKPVVATPSANSVAQASKTLVNTGSATNVPTVKVADSTKPVVSVKPAVSGMASTPSKVDIAAKSHTDSQIAAAARTGKASVAPQIQQQVMMLPTMPVQMQRPTIEMPTMPVMPTPPQLPVPERIFQMPQYFVQQPAVSSK